MAFLIILFLITILVYKLCSLIYSVIYRMWISSLVEKIRSIEDLQDIRFKDYPYLLCEIFRRKGHRVKLTDKCGEENNGLVLDDTHFVEFYKYSPSSVIEVETAMKLARCMQLASIYRGMLITLGEFKQNTRIFCHKNVITCINGQQLLAMCREVQRSKELFQGV